MTELNVLQSLFLRYQGIIGHKGFFYSTHHKCDANSLLLLCQEAIDNGHEYPIGKLNRWLGFVQGVLASNGYIDVDTERDYTRGMFHALEDAPVKTFNSATAEP